MLSKLLLKIGVLILGSLPMSDSNKVFDNAEKPRTFGKYSLNNFFDYSNLFRQEKREGEFNYRLDQLFNPVLSYKEVDVRNLKLSDIFNP